MLYEARTPEEKQEAFRYVYETNPRFREKYGSFDDFLKGEGLVKETAPPEPGVMDRVGVGAKALGLGLWDAAMNQLPGTVARVYRAGDVGDPRSGASGLVNSFVDEQTKDTQGVQGRLSPQEQNQEVVPGFTVPFTDFEVPSITGKDVLSGVGNLGYSAPSMIAGLGAGALASGSGPGAIAAASATAGAVGGVIGYRATKDQFVQEATEHFLKQRPKSSEQDVLSFQKSIEPLATEYGLWEAGPEAVSQAVTAGLIKLPVADMLSKVFPALKAAGPAMKANIMGKVASGAIKTGADLGEELATETVTQKNQGRIEAEVGMRDKAPTWGESFQEVYPQVVPMVGVTMGAGGLHNMALERARARRQAAAESAETGDEDAQNTTDVVHEATAGIDSVVSELKGDQPSQGPPAPFQDMDVYDPVWNLRRLDLSARQLPGQPTVSDYFNPATEQALTKLRGVSTDQAPFAPVGEGMPLWNVRRITPENGDLSSMVAPSPLDQALEKIRAMNTAQERDRFNANLPATDHERALAPVGEETSAPALSGLDQLQLPAAPSRRGLPYGGQDFNFVPDNARRDLPVPSTAIPMKGRMDVGEMPPSERLAPSLPGVDRLQALSDAAKTTPRMSEEPQVSPVTVSPEPPSAVDGLILDKLGKPFKDKTINLAVAQSIKRGRNVEAVQIGPNRWGMRPVEDVGPNTGSKHERASIETALAAVQGQGYDAMRDRAEELIDSGENVDVVYDVLVGMEEKATPRSVVGATRWDIFPVIDDKGTRHVGNISQPTADEINSLGFKTKPSRAVLRQENVNYIEKQHGDQLKQKDVELLRDAVSNPSEVLPNIPTQTGPGRADRVLLVKQNGKAHVAIVEMSADESDNTVLNFWKMDKKTAEAYLKKYREEKVKRQSNLGGRPNVPSIAPTSSAEDGSPVGLSGGQVDAASEGEITTPETKGKLSSPKTIPDVFRDHLLSGGKFDSIVDARKVADGLTGKKTVPGTPQAKSVDEAVESGVTMAAREIVEQGRRSQKGDVEIFRDLVDLYGRQPTLGVRTSTSVAQQAYSTPAPIAFLASHLAGVTKETSVYEPTAGNGMLLIEADPKKATVNELNPGRAASLRAQGFNVTTEDAVFLDVAPVDVVIANPPFGRVKEEGSSKSWRVGNLVTSELDHAIALKALDALKDGGRAVLILGGKKGDIDYRTRKYHAREYRNFYGELLDNFRVVDHFSVDGDLYKKQGAGYPIDVIVIAGRGKTQGRKFPAADLPRTYESFTALEDLINERPAISQVEPVLEAGERNDGTSRASSREPEDHRGRGASDVARPGQVDLVDTVGGRPAESSHVSAGGVGERGLDRPVFGREKPRGRDEERMGQPLSEGGLDTTASEDVGKRDISPQDVNGQRVQDRDEGLHRGGLGERGGQAAVAIDQEATEHQLPYRPASSGNTMGTLVPKNMSAPLGDALDRIAKKGGTTDKFVSDRLGYKPSELHARFAAEQIDALALALDNIENGNGFILGDQTGIGKGRVVAAVIRYAKRAGHIPVFVTMKPDLYADMIRDLTDIGNPGLNPVPTNSGLTGEKAIPLPDGRAIKTGPKDKHEAILRQVMNDGHLGDYDAVFTTYDQMNSVKGEDTFRREFLRNIAPKAIFILDESHNAGGTENSRGKKQGGTPNRSEFMRELLGMSPNGVLYSSATYAKRPDVMSLYFKTDMRHAVDDIGALSAAISKGGVPLQQAVAAMLTETGQYIRRERSFKGATVDTVVSPADLSLADNSAQAMTAILEFDKIKQSVMEDMKGQAAGVGEDVNDNAATGEKGASSTNFTSVMHNLIGQTLLAMKADAAIKDAVEAVKRGEKAVITVANTMGSFIEEYVQNNDLKPGDPVRLDFSDLFTRYLEKTRELVKRDRQGKVIDRHRLTDGELGPAGVAAFNNAQRAIGRADFSSMPVSPIDWIRNGLKGAGLEVDEITGRGSTIDYSGPTPVYRPRKTSSAQNISVMQKFNSASGQNGGLDVLILNQSGSTGISLHSSEKFKDQSKRTMIIAQPELNIDVFMQMLGRVFRTGQVTPPSYRFLVSDVPAEKRPAAVLGKKMASLNANTTAARTSDTSIKDIPDFLNEYGDMVAAQIMSDNDELHAKLGKPLKNAEKGNGLEHTDAMRKITGRIPLLPVKEQQALYEQIEQEYADFMKQVEALGGNVLEAKTLKLDAKRISSIDLTPAKDDSGSESPFAGPSALGKYNVKVLGKPFTSAQVEEMVATSLDGRTPRGFSNDQVANLRAGTLKYVEGVESKMRGDLARNSILSEDEEAKQALEERVKNMKERVNDAFSWAAHFINRYPVGSQVFIQTEESILDGMVTRIERKGKAANPSALGSWKMTIAVADAARQVTIPFSKLVEDSNQIVGATVRVGENRLSRERVLEKFDKGQSESREERWIATGNLLAAFDRLGKGQVINFEDNSGAIRAGILLPKGMDAHSLLADVDVGLPTVDKVFEFFKATDGRGVVKSADNNLIISRNGGEFVFSTPASKAKGGQYFLNRDLLNAANKDFVKAGNSMRVTVSESQARAMIDALRTQGTGLVAGSHREEAKSVMGINTKEERVQGPQYRRAEPHEKAAPAVTLEEAQGLLQRSGLSSLAEAYESLEMMPKAIQDVLHATNGEKEPAFFHGGKLYFNLENTQDRADLARSIAHEIIHPGEAAFARKLGLRMGVREAQISLNNIKDRIFHDYRKEIQTLLTEYGYSQDYDIRTLEGRRGIVGELLATRSETFAPRWYDKVAALVARIVNGVRAKMGLGPMRFTEAEMRELIGGIRAAFSEEQGGKVEGAGEMAPAFMRQSEAKEWARQLNEFAAGRAIPGKPLTVGTTPKVLRLLGARGLPLTMNGRKIALVTKGDHRIPLETLKDMPRALADPYMVFDSTSEADSLTVLTDLMENGSPVLAAIHLNAKDGHLDVNRVASAYGKNNLFGFLRKQGLERTFRFVNKRKTSEGQRSGGLQLPKELTFRGKRKILTEKDLGNPFDEEISGSEQPLFRRAAQVISDATLVTDLKGELRNDLYRWQKALSLPHWIAKQYPKFTALYDRQLARVDERLTKVHDAMESAQAFYDLPKTSLEEARKVIWALDGQKVEGLGAWYRTNGKFENGRTRLTLDDEHYAALERHIKDELEASAKVAKAVADVRRALDQGWVDLYNKFASKKEAADSEIANLRSQMGKIHNYFPHKRYGDFFIRAVDQEGKTVYREHFDMLFGSTEEKRRVGQERLKRRAQEMVAKLSERFPGYSWEYGDTAKLPEAVYEFPIPVDALQQIVNAGTDKLPEGSRKDVKNALDQAFADVLKERGFGSSFIQRQNIPGHEMKDVRRVFHDHLTGLYGFLTKMDAARDFTKAMRDIDARREPRLYEYAQRYMQDMLQNAGKVDQTVAALKAIGFVKYLGLRLPTAAINLTQNIVSGIPVLSMHTKSAASRYFWTTAKDLLTFTRYAMTGRLDKAKGLTPDEAAFLKEAYASGHTQAAFVEDMQLRVADSARAKAMQKVMQVAGWPMAVTERFNRATLALAAYRAAREGKVINKQTLAKFDMSAGQPATHEQASAFARMVTDDAHFVYAAGNMPQPLRGTDMGKLASTSYQFRRFSHNMISLYSEMMRSDRGKQAMLRHIGGLVALGGLASVPLYRTMLAAIMHATGDDGEELLRRMGVGDLVIYGLPSLAGLSFSGSMGMDIPVVSEMADKQGNPIWDLLGIPGAFVRETQASAAALRAGRPDRALATSPLTPSIIRNAANAIRLEEEGTRTLSGRPIPKPGERQAMKLTKGQTWLKALGFQPVEMDKAWRVSESLQAQKEFVQEAFSAFASRYVNALNAKDVAAARRVLKEVQEWNARALREKKRHMVIDLKAAVRTRMQPVQPPKQFRARAKEMVEGRQ